MFTSKMEETFYEALRNNRPFFEPPPKTERKKPLTERQLRLQEWRDRYDYEVQYTKKNRWDYTPLCICGTIVSGVTTGVCLVCVVSLDWMYLYLKVALCLISFFGTICTAVAVNEIGIRIFALRKCPYPLRKINFKQTYKFRNNGSK